MNLPVELPAGWSAETDPTMGVIITAVGADGGKGFATVSEAKRAFGLGICSPRERKLYAGRYWRKELYEEAIAALQAAMA